MQTINASIRSQPPALGLPGKLRDGKALPPYLKR